MAFGRGEHCQPSWWYVYLYTKLHVLQVFFFVDSSMIPHDFFRHLYYLPLPPYKEYPPFSHFPFHFSLAIPILHSEVTPSEDLELGTSDERKHSTSVFPGLDYLTQYGLSEFPPFTCKPHDATFLHSWIVSHSSYEPHLCYPFIGGRSFMFPLPGYCE